ncbi:MAG: tetratricopeptide repeat protein [Bacteroidales bacterium]|nr:tetratricopeptide repeat protein [Bacteroidales bacterium]
MQKILLLLFCLILINTSKLKAQTIADTLDLAYTYFDQNDYEKSAAFFDYFLDFTEGRKEDFYLAGVCYAQLNNKSKALEYINKAVKNKADYFMVLNDPLLKITYSEIRESIAKIEKFEKAFALYQESRNKSAGFKLLNLADSLYKLLPPHKISGEKLSEMAYSYSYKDKFRYYYYLDEAIFNSTNNNTVEKAGESLKLSIERQFKQFSETMLDSLFKLNSFAYYFAVNRLSKKDTTKYNIPRISFEAYLKLINNKENGWMVRGLISDKRYKLAFRLLYEGLANGRLNLEDILQIINIDSFFSEPFGKNFLTLLLSEQVIPSIENADKIIVSSSYEYLSSAREYHNYLQLKNFNSWLPSHKKYLIKKNIFGLDKYSDQDIAVGDHYPFGLYEDEFESIVDSNLNLKKAEKDYGRFFKPKDEVLLIQGIKDSKFGSAPGPYYHHPVENIPFILAVKNGNIIKSKIPTQRQHYFKPLIPFAIPSFLKENISRDEVKQVVYNYGYDNVTSFILGHLNSVTREELPGLLQFIDVMKITHTSVLDFLIQTLGNYEKYANVSSRKSVDQSFNLLNEIAKDFTNHLDGRNNVVEVFNKNRRKREINKRDWDEASKLLGSWWENYKMTNPFALPKILDCEISEINDIPEDYNGIYLNPDHKPVFYNAKNNTIYIPTIKEEETEVVELTVMTEDTETTMPISKKSSFNGKVIDNEGFIFTPVEKDKNDELIGIHGLTEKELTSLKDVYAKLSLSKNGNSYFGNYEKSYDRFYSYRFNNRLLIFWFNNITLYAAYLDDENQLYKQPVIVHQSMEQSCKETGKTYKEIPKNLNSLKFETLGDKLVVMCNFETKATPECASKSDSKIYLKLLDNNLQTINEQSMPFKDNIDFEDDPVTQMIEAGGIVYTFIHVDEGAKPLYCATFDKSLKPLAPLFKVNEAKDGTYNQYTLVKNNDKVYAVYPVNRSDDKLIAVSKISAHGNDLSPRYIALLDGYINDIKGYINKKEAVLYISEHAFKKHKIKKLVFPVKKIDK